jgi:hypothetical protein
MGCLRNAPAEGPDGPRAATPHGEAIRRRKKQYCSGNTMGPTDDHARTLCLAVVCVKNGALVPCIPATKTRYHGSAPMAEFAHSAFSHRYDLL